MNGKQVLATIGIAAALAAGGATAGYVSTDVPEASEVAVKKGPTHQVTIDNPDDVLSHDDIERLSDNTVRLDIPAVVTEIHYMVFATNHENVLDTVEEYLRDTHPALIGNADNDDDRFADGTVIIGVGLDPRQAFAYYGDDVAAELKVDHGQRDSEVLDAMKTGVRDGNIPAGLFAAARTAMDSEAAANYSVDSAEDDRVGAMLGLGGAGLGLGTAGALTGFGITNSRRKKIAQAREDYEAITTEYSTLAGRLDEIDIRANSVSSAFADAELRKQWAEVRDTFFGYHDTVSGAGGIGDIDINDDKAALRNHKKLRTATESVEHVSNAEDNINRLFEIEQGDAPSRRAALTDIREDVIVAKHKVKDSQLKSDLEQLGHRIDQLDANPSSPTFVDDFVRILGDYRLLLDQVKMREFSDVKEYEPLRQPAIYDSGYNYYGYVPFVVMNDWHTSNVETHQAHTDSGGTSAGVASSGFSAAGSSSSF
ncbi:hypothetical protein [Corynebacterium appendicis]|nr:hypothetical protein [Corynebacterium appendicis]